MPYDMNTIILEEHQFIEPSLARLNERQAEHVQSILKLNSGDEIKVALLDGNLGKGVYHPENKTACVWDITLNILPPKTLPLTLVLALPRPQMLKRILQNVACFGVEKLVLVQSKRVEKSFWQSPSAQPEAIKQQLLLGLEQANATQMPEILTFKGFKAFTEYARANVEASQQKIVLHPGQYPLMPAQALSTPSVIAIGPEGGFTDYEVEKFLELGFAPAQLGERILRVETAVTAVLARLIS